MSVCRFWWDDSDVYVYYSSRGIECCGCRLGGSYVSETEEEMAAHLRAHIEAGHTVPGYAFDGLEQPVPDGASGVRWSAEEVEERVAASRKKLIADGFLPPEPTP